MKSGVLVVALIAGIGGIAFLTFNERVEPVAIPSDAQPGFFFEKFGPPQGDTNQIVNGEFRTVVTYEPEHVQLTFRAGQKEGRATTGWRLEYADTRTGAALTSDEIASRLRERVSRIAVSKDEEQAAGEKDQRKKYCQYLAKAPIASLSVTDIANIPLCFVGY